MEDKIYNVSEFNKIVKTFIDDSPTFHDFFLKGELSSVTYYKSGHLYFTLKDSKAQIKCAAFNYKLKKIPADLKEGESVTIFGDVGFYEARGDFQILVRHIEKENSMGDLFKKLEEVKKNMEKQGYFSPLYKKELPKFPKNIGIVTSMSGAGLHDIITTARKRMTGLNFYVYPSKVQGEGSALEIIKGIQALDKIPEIDLIIAGRGGGSIEDLWSFNEEKVAMAFFNCKKPIISAVGHEIDFLLTDLVADVRAATPTQSAEIAIPSKKDIVSLMDNNKKYIHSLLIKKLNESKNILDSRKNSYTIKNFRRIFDEKSDILIRKEESLNKIISLVLKSKIQTLDLRTNKLINLNPLSTLSRGYSITKADNKIIKSSKELTVGSILETRLYDGSIISILKEIKN